MSSDALDACPVCGASLAGRRADAVVGALEAIDVAERAYAEVERFYTELLRPVPGLDGRDVPGLDLSAVKAEAHRALERGIQPPLPRSLYGAENADPTIRSAA